MIKVSVVTVSYNETNSIADTVNSVLSQSYSNIEYICVDGNSTDGTREYLEARKEDFAYFISEPDEGIYSAMNKALILCSGEVVYFLNANDVFSNIDVVEKVANEFNSDKNIDILHGKITYSYKNGELLTKSDDFYRIKNINDFYKKNLQQQAFFCKRSLYEIVGNFDQQYKICADYDWMCKALKSTEQVKYLAESFCLFNMDGVSVAQTQLRLSEKRRIIFKNSSLIEYLKYLLVGAYQKSIASINVKY